MCRGRMFAVSFVSHAMNDYERRDGWGGTWVWVYESDLALMPCQQMRVLEALFLVFYERMLLFRDVGTFVTLMYESGTKL